MSYGHLGTDPIVVTGRGVMTPYGIGLDALTQALRLGQSAVRDTVLKPLDGERPAALLPEEAFGSWLDEWASHRGSIGKKGKKLCRRAPRSVISALPCAVDAWIEAGLEEVNLDSVRQGIVVGGHQLSAGFTEGLKEKFETSPHHLPPSYAVRMMDTDHVGVVTELLGIQGYGMSVGGASASGLMALVQAVDLIRANRVERCLVLAPMAELSQMAVQSFDAMGALGGMANRGTGASRPFDKSRDGFIYGQASAAIVIESASVAAERGARALGSIIGTGVALDGNSSPSPSPEGEARAMRLALADAGVESSAIRLVNAHGTSSLLGDEVELDAIRQVFGEHASELKVQATKGITGHTLWAAGLLEVLVVLLQFENAFVHPNLNLIEPIGEGVGLLGAECEAFEHGLTLSNSFGFGGINVSAVMAPSVERKVQ